VTSNPYLQLGTGSDPVAWACLLLAGLAWWFGPTIGRFAQRLPTRWLLLALAFAALLLSLGYVQYYLRGGPRIIDSAYYYLEARALAVGRFAFEVPEPVAAFGGRFLVSPRESSLAVIFPPGYPAVLALAVRAGAPLLLGPLLAAGLVFATHWLARTLGSSETAARAAALFSVLSAALRYHTADTMSHGWAALLLTLALAATLQLRPPLAVVSGACVGWLCATRPVTGLVALLALGAWLFLRSKKQAAWFCAALTPGFTLLLLHQHAATGEWLRSSQTYYYALADGPPGCFRYGFGRGIGCMLEHGDYVQARLPHGHTLSSALLTSGRRLLVHTLDILNFAPLAALVPTGAWLYRHAPGMKLAAALIALVVLGYVPFYFEASFPGGGARLFADVIPIELVLIARVLERWRALRWAAPLALLGFGVHVSGQHRLLRDREGGRPLFESAVLQRAGVQRGLLFVSSDHAFALGHDPQIKNARTGVVVARQRGDALDHLLWQQLGRPPTYRYTFDWKQPHATPAVHAWSSPERASTRIEAESLWPPLGVQSGWLTPSYPPQSCASGGRGLLFHAESAAVAARFAVPRTLTGRQILLGWVGAPPRMTAESAGSTVEVEWNRAGECAVSNPIRLSPNALHLILNTKDSGTLDYIEWQD